MPGLQQRSSMNQRDLRVTNLSPAGSREIALQLKTFSAVGFLNLRKSRALRVSDPDDTSLVCHSLA